MQKQKDRLLKYPLYSQYYLVILILKIYSLEPIFYIATLIDGVLVLLYNILALFVIVDMDERVAKKLKNSNEQQKANNKENTKILTYERIRKEIK